MKKDAGLKSNFHTHTFRCGHAKGDIKDYTKSAISFGFKNIGFSDHAFFPGIHHEFMRGDFSLLDDYIKAFQKAKKKYGKKINMYDENHILIKTFNAKTAALDFLGLKGHVGLDKAIKEKTLYKGYFWSVETK